MQENIIHIKNDIFQNSIDGFQNTINILAARVALKKNMSGKIYEIRINNASRKNCHSVLCVDELFNLINVYTDFIEAGKININIKSNISASFLNLMDIKRNCDLSLDTAAGTIDLMCDLKMSYKINISTTTPISFRFYTINSEYRFVLIDYDNLMDNINIEYTLTPECIKDNGISLICGTLNIKPNRLCKEIIIPENKNIKKSLYLQIIMDIYSP